MWDNKWFSIRFRASHINWNCNRNRSTYISHSFDFHSRRVYQNVARHLLNNNKNEQRRGKKEGKFRTNTHAAMCKSGSHHLWAVFMPKHSLRRYFFFPGLKKITFNSGVYRWHKIYATDILFNDTSIYDGQRKDIVCLKPSTRRYLLAINRQRK